MKRTSLRSLFLFQFLVAVALLVVLGLRSPPRLSGIAERMAIVLTDLIFGEPATIPRQNR